MNKRIAILGWGSLLWDSRGEFDEQHDLWQFDGPVLPLEFARVSKNRGGALTLVIDFEHGSPCQVAFAMSKRLDPFQTRSDLRAREGTTTKNIGLWLTQHVESPNNDTMGAEAIISNWARQKELDAVVWTALESNFEEICATQFSTATALGHLRALDTDIRISAMQYIWMAPAFVDTKLRRIVRDSPDLKFGQKL